MKLSIRLAVAVLLVLSGWIAGSAQTTKGDFVIRVEAPGPGRTTVECVEGCTALVGGRDIGLHREGEGRDSPTYWFGCGAARCQGTFHGFLKR
jgi:hypothetical protein